MSSNFVMDALISASSSSSSSDSTISKNAVDLSQAKFPTKEPFIDQGGENPDSDTPQQYYFVPQRVKTRLPLHGTPPPTDWSSMLPWQTYSHHPGQEEGWNDYRKYYQRLVRRCGWTPPEARQNLALHLSGPAAQLTKHLDLTTFRPDCTLEGLLVECDHCFQTTDPVETTLPLETVRGLPILTGVTATLGEALATLGEPPALFPQEVLPAQDQGLHQAPSTARKSTPGPDFPTNSLRQTDLPPGELQDRLRALPSRLRLPDELGYNAQSLNEMELACYVKNLYHSSQVTQAEADFYHQNGFKIIRTRDLAEPSKDRDHMELICWNCQTTGQIRNNCPFRQDTTTTAALHNWVPATTLPPRGTRIPEETFPSTRVKRLLRPRPRLALLEDLTQKMTGALRTVATAIAAQPSGPHEISVTFSVSPSRPSPGLSSRAPETYPSRPPVETRTPVEPPDGTGRDYGLEKELFQYFCQKSSLPDF